MLKPAVRPAAAPAAKAAPVQSGVTTATLIRGRVYYYKNEQFLYGQPVEVDTATAEILKELHEAINDTEGETFEKAYFHVKTNQPKPSKLVEDGSRPPVRRLPIIPLGNR